ncbi:cation:proton antiporter [Microbacterium invictum]|uniref:CPA1 family monovalent cation:H+ antiporter n=1 Tax=Microbacterium invictum TaxID=515415 RepID=A0AA40SN96_9MICO|nr:sodium:proton antiporter [Microbacterium invictum]MBB4139230.1 CPA1 family monovalent cation:H+ antiporter [Microbacterium invictum]
MEFVVLLIGLMFATVLLAGLGERIRLPYPVLVLIFSAAAAWLPFVPELHIDPELILPLFLPPLLFAVAQRSSWGVFRLRWKTLVLMAVLLVALTAVAVAGVAWYFMPILSFPAAIALGAIVAPPDPVAVEAVAGKVRMPRRIVTMLQTEGLFNDAMAIVIFQTAVSAALSGSEVGWGLIPSFLAGAAGAVILGFLMAWVVGAINRVVPDRTARTAITLVAPYAVYMLSEQVHFSGVVAVVVTAVELVRRDRPQDSQERLTRTSFWEVVEMLTTGVAFGLVGIEMRYVIEDEGANLLGWVPAIIAICVVVVLVRLVWVAIVLGAGWRAEGVPEEKRVSLSSRFKDVILVTWCGMRGLATLALALALPTGVGSGRNFVITTACAVLFVTLVIPGLTLPALVRILRPVDDHALVESEERQIALRAERAAVTAIAKSPHLEGLDPELVTRARARVSGLHSVLEHDDDVIDDDYEAEQRTKVRSVEFMLRDALSAARREVLSMRGEKGVDPEAVNAVLRRLDLRTVSLDSNPH